MKYNCQLLIQELESNPKLSFRQFVLRKVYQRLPKEQSVGEGFVFWLLGGSDQYLQIAKVGKYFILFSYKQGF